MGKKLRDVLPRLKREILDVEIELIFKELKTEVLECMGLKLDMLAMLTLYDIYLGQGCDPNVKRERLMERWVT